MPHEDLHKALERGGAKQYRRRRKHQGADWTPEKSSALSSDGYWCKACRQRHGAMAKNVLGVTYERRNGVWYILWTCLKSGDVIHDEALVNKGGGQNNGNASKD